MVTVVIVLETSSSGCWPLAYLSRVALNARVLGADHLVIVDDAGWFGPQFVAEHSDSELAVEAVHSLRDVGADGEWVFFEDPVALGSSEVEYSFLEDFEHPENAVYAFGGDHGGLKVTKHGVWVALDCGPIYPDAVMAIALHDRKLKGV